MTETSEKPVTYTQINNIIYRHRPPSKRAARANARTSVVRPTDSDYRAALDWVATH